MIVDNFDQILEFNDPNEFYFLQIIQRKKDGCVTDTGNNGYRTVKTYYIFRRITQHFCILTQENKTR